MIPNLLRLMHRPPPPDRGREFVEEVRLAEHAPVRNRRVERVILAGWVLIAGKCWGVIWLVDHYHLAVNPWWVNAPTVLFAGLCTAVYVWRD